MQAPEKSAAPNQDRLQEQPARASSVEENNDDSHEALSSSSDSEASDDATTSSEQSPEAVQSDHDEATLARSSESALNGLSEQTTKKRKRSNKEDIEDTYMRKLAHEEEKEEQQLRQKKPKTTRPEPQDQEVDFTIPKHESLAETGDKDASEFEKAARTVFLSNVSVHCVSSKSAEKALKKHLESFIQDLAENKPAHKLESIRFRSTAFSSALPKRAAFAKKDIMDATAKSTNAYAVYTTKVAAREAVKRLNGSLLLDRHLHVDSVAHPTKVDHRRCVFVGNLPFVDDESQTPNEDGSKKKPKPAADVEEGLWVQFAKAGKIESVRVVRDAQTRVGKGFAYVQFMDENGVESALQLDEKKFPPMLPRKLRVTRCKAERKKSHKSHSSSQSTTPRANGKTAYAPKLTEEQKSTQGRARSMLGKVAKAQMKGPFVFEGHRASEKQGKSGLKFKGSGGKKKGVNGRKSRSATWKKTGGKK